MLKRTLIFIFLIQNLFVFGQNFHQYVNPMIGTGGTGHTFPGATVPFGMVQLSPDTRIDGSWEGCSGYHHSDSRIYGFSHTHLNGTGVSDYGDILLMPTMGKPSLDRAVYSSTFSHDNETASAGFYAVKLDDDAISVRLTTSTRVGFHEYTFSKKGQANIILDLNHRDELLEGSVRQLDDRTVEVFRRSKAWATNQYCYALLEFSVPLKITATDATKILAKGHFEGEKLAVAFSKKVKKGEKIAVKVSLSFTGHEGAKRNSTEIAGWDFEATKAAAEMLWDKELSKIDLKTTDDTKRTIFYTALYHTFVQPNIAQDIDGSYRGRDNAVHRAEGFTYYTVFSLWDTFRAAHPLYTLIDRKRTTDFIRTFLTQFEQGGRLPVWELASNETDCMIGYHSVSVIADAMMKDIGGFDYEAAYKAARHSAMLEHLGLEAYKKQGFISIDDEHESVSKTLEYAYDDWCIAQMALRLGKIEDYGLFMRRSQAWKNLFNPETTFIQPKKNGGWALPFDPTEVNNNYTEANGWQYTFFVPQDIEGLIAAMGGAAAFEAKLDEMFGSENQTSGRHQVDITGLIGQYAHGNEPSHNFAYLYDFVGKPEKTTEKVHFILDNFYKNDPDGLIGNEDCGQMSAWYVLSSLGIYAVTPGQPTWTATAPYFEEATVHLEDGTKRVIRRDTERKTLQSLGFETVKPLKKPLKNAAFAEIVPVPNIAASNKSFMDSLQISLSAQGETPIFYTQNETQPQLYTKPFWIKSSAKIEAFAKNATAQSATATANFFKKPNNFSVTLNATYNPQYHAGGAEGLIDGIFGNENWRKGDWQGYQNQDFEAIIDLKTPKNIRRIAANFLQDTRSWILMPTKVEFFVSENGVDFISENGIDFQLLDTVLHDIDPKEYNTVIKSLESQKTAENVRFIKIKAYNFGALPEWHQGFPYQGQAFIFIDEIEVDF